MDNKKEQHIAVIFSIVGTLAILVNLSIKGFTPENSLDAIKDLAGLLITIAVFLVAYSLSIKSESFIDAGLSALKKVCKNNRDLLQGPEFDKSDYNPEEISKNQRMRYLFFSKNKYRQKVAFIPLEPIEQGILDVRLSKATLVNLGYDAKDPQTEKMVTDAQLKVYQELEILLKKKHQGLYEILNNKENETNDSKFKNSAIVIDFNEEKLKIKGLSIVIYDCTEKALEIILSNYKK